MYFSPLPLMDPLQTNFNHLFVNVVKDTLTEYSYSASVAGLHYMIMDSTYGIEVNTISTYTYDYNLLHGVIFSIYRV